MDIVDDHEPRRTLSSEAFQKLNALLGDPAEKEQYEGAARTCFRTRAGVEAERISISNALPRISDTRVNLSAFVGPVELIGAGVVYVPPYMTLQRDPACDLTDGREAWVLLPKETP